MPVKKRIGRGHPKDRQQRVHEARAFLKGGRFIGGISLEKQNELKALSNRIKSGNFTEDDLRKVEKMMRGLGLK